MSRFINKLTTTFQHVLVGFLIVCGSANHTLFAQVGTPTDGAGQVPNSFSVSGARRTIATRLNAFSIPFQIDNPADRYVEVQLYLSRDRGKTWQLHGQTPTRQTSFPFHSDGDGEYWFALKTLDRNQQLLPEGKITEPELRVIVDSKRPELVLQTETDAAGRVLCRWQAEDENLLVESLRIRYRANVVGDAESESWTQVPIQLPARPGTRLYSDQLAWWPKLNAPHLIVRLEIADAAGNIATAERQVAVRQVAVPRSPTSTVYRQPNNNRQASAPANGARVAGTGQPALVNNQSVDAPTIQASAQPQCRDGVCQLPGSQAAAIGGGIGGPHREAVSELTSQLDQSEFQPVGSPADYASPPEPHRIASGSRTAQLPLTPSQNLATQAPAPNQVRWPSQTDSWIGQPGQTGGNTLLSNSHPDQSPASQPLISYRPETRKTEQIGPTQDPGESFVREQGDLVIAQSTTMGRGRQFRTQAQVTQEEVVAQPNPQQPSLQPAVSNLANSLPSGSGAPENVEARSALVERLPTPVNNSTNNYINQPPASGMKSPRNPDIDWNSVDTDVFRQVINQRRFNLQYGIQSVDPSSVTRVVLWSTQDGGRTWNSWLTDPDLASPFPVEVEQQGVYGFRIVVHARDGLTGTSPAPGDEPDMIVVVDLDEPLVQIVSVPYGRGEAAGKLVINWTARDDHFVMKPIQLSYSTSPQGPWVTIESGLRNVGSYAWTIGPEVPGEVYLRIVARDRAGNLGEAITPTPIDLRGLIPRGKIYGLQKMN